MRNAGTRAGLWLFGTLVAVGVGAVVLACEAKLETVCHDGPCQEESTTTTGSGGSGGTAASGGTGGGDTCSDEPADGDFPCDVFTVLEAKCHTCHNGDHLGGAPIDLLECSRFHDKDCGDVFPRFRVANNYVHSGLMPFGAAPDLTEAEKTTLIDWLDGCGLCVPAGTGCSGTVGAKACFE